jgi:multifunctional 2-oxoglutarate metabolism enzyme
VYPVVLGMVRAQQSILEEELEVGQESRWGAGVMALLFHGDASFSGLGIVTETLQMSRLDGYKVGGTVHVILNNQLGFTTEPKDGRSTFHPTDVVKGFGVPVVHVVSLSCCFSFYFFTSLDGLVR